MKNADKSQGLSPVQHMMLSSFGFAAMGAIIKHVNRLPVWEVVFFRAFINFLWLVPWAMKNKTLGIRKEKKTLLIRGVSGCIAMYSYFYAIETLKLADAAMLNYTSPVLVLILSALFLGERLKAISVIFIMLAMLGAGFLIKPSGNWLHATSSATQWGGVFGMISAFFSAIAYVSVKHATRRISPQAIVFTFAGISSIISLLPMLSHYVPPTQNEWILLFACGTMAAVAQNSMTIGYARMQASVAASFSLVTVIMMAAWGWLLWNEVPDAWSIIGSILIATGIIGSYRTRQI